MMVAAWSHAQSISAEHRLGTCLVPVSALWGPARSSADGPLKDVVSLSREGIAAGDCWQCWVDSVEPFWMPYLGVK
jgi:hypothetical protein